MLLSNKPTRRKCGTGEGNSVHILSECEALASLRHTHLCSFFLDAEDIRKESAIWVFAKGTGLLLFSTEQGAQMACPKASVHRTRKCSNPTTIQFKFPFVINQWLLLSMWFSFQCPFVQADHRWSLLESWITSKWSVHPVVKVYRHYHTESGQSLVHINKLYYAQFYWLPWSTSRAAFPRAWHVYSMQPTFFSD
jgi:hypothetical protein